MTKSPLYRKSKEILTSINKEENRDEFVRKINCQMIEDALDKNEVCKKRMMKALSEFMSKPLFRKEYNFAEHRLERLWDKPIHGNIEN